MRYRRPVVQLTTLLDLLFIMIFVSLYQSKDISFSDQKTPPAQPQIQEPQKKTINQSPFALTAIFNFFPTSSNPHIPSGSYRMKGEFDPQSRVIALGGTGWIDKPAGYEMVPLKGKIHSSNDRFLGIIEFEGCEEFELRRAKHEGQSVISGEWSGKYRCMQGETGLTLIID